jgi:membrane protein
VPDPTKPQSADPQATSAGRGREAAEPQHIPARGWKDILIRAWHDSSEKNISLVAGGVTYYVLLALFPGLAALVSIYGLIANPATIASTINSLSGMVLPSAQKLISDELHQLVSTSHGALGFGAIIGILIALYSASRGMSGMISALDIAYGQEEKRSFIRFNLLALALTVGLLIGGIIALALVAILPAVLSSIGASGIIKTIIYIFEWPVLIALMMGMLAVLYRYAPDRDEPRWAWTSPGAIAASVLWVIVSILFSIYVAHFGNYNKTYGSLGAVVVLMTWLWLTAYLVLLGAEINGESERQTKQDTTTGEPQSMGNRGATAADTLGKRQGS